MLIKKELAVKITHIPTGIIVVVDCGYSRSLHKQKEAALKILKSKLWMREHFKD